MENFLEIKELKKSYGNGEAKQDVLRGMDFTVKKGEFCVLLGPSGSGKSTLLNIIGGIDTPDSGYVSINGDKLSFTLTHNTNSSYKRANNINYNFNIERKG